MYFCHQTQCPNKPFTSKIQKICWPKHQSEQSTQLQHKLSVIIYEYDASGNPLLTKQQPELIPSFDKNFLQSKSRFFVDQKKSKFTSRRCVYRLRGQPKMSEWFYATEKNIYCLCCLSNFGQAYTGPYPAGRFRDSVILKFSIKMLIKFLQVPSVTRRY